jgi:polyisoprenoid-binding protein YceI
MSKRTISRLLICFIGSLLVVKGYAQTYTTSNGHAEFHAKASLNSYTGKSDQLKGTINVAEKTVRFSVPFQSIDTGIKKRNKHMQELIETDKYPDAAFEGKIISEFDINKKESQKVTVKGNFTMHGATKEITVEGTLTGIGDRLTVEADWNVLITDYNITPPKKLGNKVQDEHTIRIKADLEKSN